MDTPLDMIVWWFEKRWKKYFLKCPDCGRHLQYWKPISDKDIESWFCKRCPNLFKERGKNITL